MQLVREFQTQQHRARHNEINRFRTRSVPVILERVASHISSLADCVTDNYVNK